MRLRGGIPRFAARACAGERATIVAFGTSMTLFGQYLAHLVPAVRAATGNPAVTLVNSGLRGYTSMYAAFRVAADVLPHDPDLVILEFAHNEVTAEALSTVPIALHGIVAQVRAARPACEFVFVYLAQPGKAQAGPTPAMLLWEDVAQFYGFPSIDVATAVEAIVASGAATWRDGPRALTADGIHYTAFAEEAVGGPFAAAVAELIAASIGREHDAIPGPRTPFERTARAGARHFISGGSWVLGIPHDHDRRNAEAYDDEAAQAQADGASLRIEAHGVAVFVWARGHGRCAMVDAAGARDIVIDHAAWNAYALRAVADPSRHVIELTVSRGLMFGDVLVAGVPLDL